MKKLNILLFAITFVFITITCAKPVFAYTCPECCAGGTLCDTDSFCMSSCSCCRLQPIPPTERIVGKVINPVLPLNLSITPGVAFLGNIVRLGISLAFVVGALIFFFMLLSGGIKWISAGGDKVRMEGAQKQLTHALVGLLLLLSVFAIINLIERLFGISLLNITIPTL